MQKVSNVDDDTLVSLFIAGLQKDIKQELLTTRPASLNEAFAIAQRIAARNRAVAASPITRPTWADRDPRPRQTNTPALTTTAPPKAATDNNRKPCPVVRLTAAERTDRAHRNLCYYCPEKYTLEHVCNGKFYALIGVEDDEEVP